MGTRDGFLPVIDFSKEDCLKPGTSSWLSVRREVCRALEEIGGFMAIIPDKVSAELHQTIFGALKDLFEFPAELKSKNRYEENPFCGHFIYNSVHESLGIQNPTHSEETQKFTHLFWPNQNDQFRDSVDSYAKVMMELDHVVTRMVFENYGMEKYHDEHIRSTSHFIQFAKYKEPRKAGSDVGLVSHTDKNFNTILHQNHVNGLEINTDDDEWIMFDPHLPSSFLFIASDVFKVWSNGRIRACRHRVNVRENDEARYSVGFFSVKIGVTTVPKELVDEEHPLRYKSLDQVEYIQAQRKNGIECTPEAYCGV
ncbi:probable 2-oxoglutarate-dependent dioxygenase AOP1 [Pyrus communis]|uniref:probable 2-oxoglutarate-dependent dioxygenase AOP1 n=1 Tax=Pyrus communis TaxID=23211 RepID=UPI0035C1C7DF